MCSQKIFTDNCASQIQLFPTFLLSVAMLVVIWSYPEEGYNSATRHFVWLVRSPGTVYHLTFVRHLHYQLSKTCSRHIFSHFPTSLTNCFQSTSSEYCMHLYYCKDSSHVTVPYKMSSNLLLNCRATGMSTYNMV